MAEGGVMRACVAAIMGVALAIAGPYAFTGVEATWQKIVLLSLILACVAILVTTVVLSMVARCALVVALMPRGACCCSPTSSSSRVR